MATAVVVGVAELRLFGAVAVTEFDNGVEVVDVDEGATVDIRWQADVIRACRAVASWL